MNNRNKLDHEFSLPSVQKKADLIIRNSFNLKKTKSLMITIVIFCVIVISLFVYMGFIEKNVQALSIVSIIYVVVTFIEKIGYGFGVIAYKKVIQKILYDDKYRDKYINILNLQDKNIIGKENN